MNWSDIGKRALLTFVQAFVAVLLVTGVENINSIEDAKPAIVAGVAALLSLVYNMTKQYTTKGQV
jgi:multisubunit Na+/H+ antiporter MnhB subunit